MAEFFIHVELLEADSTHYTELHHIMVQDGFHDFVETEDKKTRYSLGQGLFRSFWALGHEEIQSNNHVASQMLFVAKQSIEKLGKPYRVLVTRNALATGSGLRPRFKYDVEIFSSVENDIASETPQ
ncbi:hypothetical protein [Fibrella forsythiae]|uniref:Uncharacterized protein n=1 Tax=Fibrella forsythiae TaxID=2817061 RepID=A0ABS3JNL7_9BACT|nr:hypothetical protein [Fibrella forsythiae]MBO0951570.1 hypothetical protein [Fibrella forsythiae]